MAQGGYQAPAQPAPVSGPGRLSRRTDGQPVAELPDAAYGEAKTYRELEQAAPMAATPGGAQPGAVVPPADLSNVVPLSAPTQNPDEPVTAGADAGLGPGSDVLGLGEDDDPGVQNLRGVLPTLELMANMPSAGRELRQLVRRIRAMM